MIERKTLVLGKMPEQAKPDTHLAAGPWCFAGSERLFPNWETSFTFAPEPLVDRALHAAAIEAAEYLCVKTIPAISRCLAEDSDKIPLIYWQTLLCPWAIDVAKQIVERAFRCALMIKMWGHINFIVPIVADTPAFDFVDEHDFTLRGALGVEFNHWLFSVLLSQQWPQAWQKETVTINPPMPEKKDDNYQSRIKGLARKTHLLLPFPRLKGMRLAQAARFSMAVNHSCRQEDHSTSMERFARNWPDSAPSLKDCLDIFKTCLPESLKKLRHEEVMSTRKPKIRVASVIAYEDASYRQKLAAWRAAGNRLAYVQHGGNYGQVREACDTVMVEYSQDAFFTWGWEKHGRNPGNFIPLPYPQLAAIYDRWQLEPNAPLLFVGTEMAAFPYRLDSRPTPMQFLAYRDAKAKFFGNLDTELLENSFYRPYFDLPGMLEDAAWLLPRFPRLRLCKGPLQPCMLGCRLLILDHHGTTMLEAFAANTPMLLYWNRSHWPLTEECEKLLDILENAGIWFDEPEKAARKAREIWPDTAQWWNGGEIQDARRAWIENQALCDPVNLDQLWVKTLKKL